MPFKDPVIAAAYAKEYREKNKARLVEIGRIYRKENAEVICQRKKDEYQRDKETIKARVKAWAIANPERVKAMKQSPEYKARKNARRRANYVAHPLPPPLTREEKLERKRADYIQNRDRYLQRGKENNKKHPERGKLYYHRKPYWRHKFERALSKAHRKTKTIEDLDSIREYFKQVFSKPEATCDYCRGTFPITQIVIDHKQPYALGGIHAVSNFSVSCAHCNLKKGEKPYELWKAL